MVITQLKTAEDLVHLEDDEAHFELIEGVLVEVTPPSLEHTSVVTNVSGILREQIQLQGLGRVFTGDPGVLLRRNPDTVLAPDLAVVAAHRLPLKLPVFMDTPPDWAIEVVSPSNTRREIDRKIRLYLEHGVKSVWIVAPDLRQVSVHSADSEPRVLGDSEVVTGIEPFPQAAVLVSSIFD